MKRKGKIATLALTVAALGIALYAGSEAQARSSYFTGRGCSSCHTAPVTATCNGCHHHGADALSGKTNKTSYAPGETVSVTINGGSESGWVSVILYDQNNVQIARSSGNASGMGHSATFPAVLTAPAPAAAGTYTWKAAWHGNINDSGSAHGDATVNTNSFTVTAPVDTTPPTLSISTPSNGLQTNNPLLNISGTTSDASGIKSLTINGNAVTVNAGGSFSYDLQLSSGVNTITSIVTDTLNNQTTDTRTVTLVVVYSQKDFNGDGVADILWQNTANEQLAAWYMNGINMSSAVLLNPSKAGEPNWRFVDLGDFNSDGKTDLLWQNSINGDLVVWYMNGVNMSGSSYITPMNAGSGNTDWKAIATGDFKGSTSNDILWQNSLTEEIVVWQMNGTIMTNTAMLSPSKPGAANWKFVGLGDFNADGNTDILWQNSISGDLTVWQMNGVNMTAATMLNPANAGTGSGDWKAVAVGDYNQDSKPDVLWQNNVSGDSVVWYMDGINLIESKSLNPLNAGTTDWKIKK